MIKKYLINVLTNLKKIFAYVVQLIYQNEKPPTFTSKRLRNVYLKYSLLKTFNLPVFADKINLISKNMDQYI